MSLIKEDTSITETMGASNGVNDSNVNSSHGGNWNSGHQAKESKIHQEFEEVYKKSTENLFFVPASRGSIDGLLNLSAEHKAGIGE